MNADDLRGAWAALGEEAEALRGRIRELPVASAPDPAALRAEVERRFPLDAPTPLPDLVRAGADLLRRHAVHVIHPRYFGLYNPTVRDAAPLGDALAALYNPQLAAWSHAPAAAELEQHVLPGRSEAARGPSDAELAATMVLSLGIREASAKVRAGPPLDSEEDHALRCWAGEIPLRLAAGTPRPDPALAPDIAVPDAIAHYTRRP